MPLLFLKLRFSSVSSSSSDKRDLISTKTVLNFYCYFMNNILLLLTFSSLLGFDLIVILCPLSVIYWLNYIEQAILMF